MSVSLPTHATTQSTKPNEEVQEYTHLPPHRFHYDTQPTTKPPHRQMSHVYTRPQSGIFCSLGFRACFSLSADELMCIHYHRDVPTLTCLLVRCPKRRSVGMPELGCHTCSLWKTLLGCPDVSCYCTCWCVVEPEFDTWLRFLCSRNLDLTRGYWFLFSPSSCSGRWS